MLNCIEDKKDETLCKKQAEFEKKYSILIRLIALLSFWEGVKNYEENI